MTNEQAAYGQDFLQAVLNCRSERLGSFLAPLRDKAEMFRFAQHDSAAER